jgi:hypothetical protein
VGSPSPGSRGVGTLRRGITHMAIRLFRISGAAHRLGNDCKALGLRLVSPGVSLATSASTYCAFFAQETRSWMPIPALGGSSVHAPTIVKAQICRVCSRCDGDDMRIVSMLSDGAPKRRDPNY